MWLYLLLQGRSVASPLMHERLLKLPDGANQLTLQTAFHSMPLSTVGQSHLH